MPQTQLPEIPVGVGLELAFVREKVETPPLLGGFPVQVATAMVSPWMAMPVAPASVTVLAAVGAVAESWSALYIRTPSENVAQRFPSASKATARAFATESPVCVAW